jgi:hypothetical protein
MFSQVALLLQVLIEPRTPKGLHTQESSVSPAWALSELDPDV